MHSSGPCVLSFFGANSAWPQRLVAWCSVLQSKLKDLHPRMEWRCRYHNSDGIILAGLSHPHIVQVFGVITKNRLCPCTSSKLQALHHDQTRIDLGSNTKSLHNAGMRETRQNVRLQWESFQMPSWKKLFARSFDPAAVPHEPSQRPLTVSLKVLLSPEASSSRTRTKCHWNAHAGCSQLEPRHPPHPLRAAGNYPS